LKPDWDKLSEKFNYKSNGHVIDVDCTSDDAKKLCSDYGVQGYPTIKYFKKGGDPKGTSYEGGRDYNELKKFMTKNSKKPCDPVTLENCGKKDKKYIDEIKDLDAAAIQAAFDVFDKEITEKRNKKRRGGRALRKAEGRGHRDTETSRRTEEGARQIGRQIRLQAGHLVSEAEG